MHALNVGVRQVDKCAAASVSRKNIETLCENEGRFFRVPISSEEVSSICVTTCGLARQSPSSPGAQKFFRGRWRQRRESSFFADRCFLSFCSGLTSALSRDAVARPRVKGQGRGLPFL